MEKSLITQDIFSLFFENRVNHIDHMSFTILKQVIKIIGVKFQNLLATAN